MNATSCGAAAGGEGKGADGGEAEDDADVTIVSGFQDSFRPIERGIKKSERSKAKELRKAIGKIADAEHNRDYVDEFFLVRFGRVVSGPDFSFSYD